MNRTRQSESLARIRVVGIGGGGSNAVNRMIASGVAGIDFIVVNTDAQALLLSSAPTQIRIGERTTHGLGAGGDPEKGENSAKESEDEIRQAVKGSDMVFVTAGMGGGTGTGAAPIVARIAREEGALTIGVVTRPFTFEGSKRSYSAEHGINNLRQNVDTLIVVPNDRLVEMADRRLSLTDSFRLADDVLRQGMQGISELITVPGLINLDFADVRTVMREGGGAIMAIGHGRGEDRARIAAEEAISSRLLDVTIDGARGILLNITGGSDLSLYEVSLAARLISERAHPEAEVIFGAVLNEEVGDEVFITVIATGFEPSRPQRHLFQEAQQHPGAIAEAARPVPARAPQPSPRSEVATDLGMPRFSTDLEVPAFWRRQA